MTLEIGSPSIVNDTTANSQYTAATAKLADGRYATVWTDYITDFNDGNSESSIAVKLSAADGSSLQTVAMLGAGDAALDQMPRIAALQDGGFVVTWQRPGPDVLNEFGDMTNSYVLSAQRFDASGQKLGQPLQINSIPTSAQPIAATAGTADGGFVAAWTDAGAKVLVQRYDASGVAAGGNVVVSAGAHVEYPASVTALKNGGYVVTWVNHVNANSGSNQMITAVQAQCFDANGQAQSLPIELDMASAAIQRSATAVATQNGGFALVWAEGPFTSDPSADTLTIVAQRFDAQGNALGDALRGDTYPVTGSLPALAATETAGGDLLIAWFARAQVGADDSVFVQTLKTDGSANDAAMKVADGLGDWNLSLIALDNGKAVVTWTGADANPETPYEYDVYSSVLSLGADTSPDTGTPDTGSPGTNPPDTGTPAPANNTLPVFTGTVDAIFGQVGPELATNFFGTASLAIDASGTPYVAYENGGSVTVSYFNGTEWKNLPSSSFASSGQVNMAIGPDGTPYVAFVQGSDTDATVMKLVHGDWVQVGTSGFSQGVASLPQLGFDAAGAVYVTYINDLTHGLNVAKYANGAWTPVGDTDIATLAASDVEMSVGADGTAYLAYVDAPASGVLNVLRFNGQDWVSVGAPVSNAARAVQSAVDADGHLYVAYQQADQGVVVSRYDGNGWSELPALPAGLIGPTGAPIELLVADDGVVYLSAQSTNGYPGQMHALRFDGQGWQPAAASGTYLGAAGMALGADGTVYTIYTDADPLTPGLAVYQSGEVILAKGTTTGTAITGLTATDADNDVLTFSIGGKNADLFEVRDGAVRFIDAPAAGTYTVAVTVSDGTGSVTRTVSITVDTPPANTAPVLDTSASPALPAVAANGIPHGAVGSTVKELLGNAATDADSDAALGIAVTGVGQGGKLYYSLNDGQTWTALDGTVSASSALLLGSDARVYFAASATGTVDNALSFKAWDLSQGTSGDTGVNTTSGSYLVAQLPLGESGGAGRGTDIAVVGRYAYVADGSPGLQIVDIGDPAHPVIVGTFDTENKAVDVQIVGHYAYIADGFQSAGLTIVDIANPEKPTFVGSASTSLYPAYVAVSGNYAYLTGNNGLLEIFNIANPSAPTAVSFIGGSGGLHGPSAIAVAGNYVYLGTMNGLTVVDVTTRGEPEQLPIAAPTGGQVLDILIDGGIAYVAGMNGLSVFDLQNPAQPNLLTTWPVAFGARDLTKDGDKLYVASAGGGVIVVDVSMPSAPAYLTKYDAAGAESVAVANGIVYTAYTTYSPTFTPSSSIAAYALNDTTAFSTATDTVSAAIAPAHPVLNLGTGTTSFTENGAAVAVAPALVLTDIDSTTIAKVTVYLESNTSIVIGGSPAYDVTDAESLVFTANDHTGDIAGTYDAEEGLTLTSASGNATLAQWQAALRAVAYLNTSDAPVGSRVVHFVAIDADDANLFGEATRVVDITATNDAPQIAGVPETATPVTVGAATALGITVADPDSTMLTLTLTAANGTLTGLADADADTDGIQLTGTVSQINAALAQAQFTMNAAGSGSVTLSLKDGGDILPTVKTYAFTASAPSTPTPPTPPVTPTTPIDGVPVQVGTGSDGQQQIIVPVVTDSRDDDPSTPNSKLADITLVKNAGGAALLNVGVPVGTGVTAHGPATPVSGNTAQTVLDGRITAANGSAELKAAGQNFLSTAGSGTQVVIQTVTLTAQADGAPLVISAANTGDGHKTAIVIDTSALAGNTAIGLDNVDFAIVVGDARVTGGAGANTVYGDDGRQFIVLGEDDDVLHGGGNDDTVGSLRGNDQTFGDDGNDVVYGGTGNDVLHGGAGNDRMNGGFGFDQAVQSGVLTDYAIAVDGHTVVLTNTATGEIDRFLDVEAITFDSGRALIVAHEAGDVATLTAQFADAQLIELNANRAVTGSEGNDEVTPELGMALNIDLGAGQDIVRLAGARADVHIDVEAGQRAELTRLEDGAMLAFNNVEMLAFESGEVTVLAHNHEEAVIGRAYELLLGRNVDTDGYTFWVQGIENGADLHTTLTAMMQSPEFTGASMSNADFVELLYATGFDRASDPDGKAFWVNALDNGASRAQIVETFAASDEAVTAIGSTIDVTVLV